MKKNRLGNHIKRQRKKLGMSQKEMSGKLGLKQSTYSNYENGYNIPPVEILDLLSEILGEDLFKIKDEYNAILDINDEKNSFLEGYEHETEQLLFFEELAGFRHYIDNIENKRTRRELSDAFSQFLDEIESCVSGIAIGECTNSEIRGEAERRFNLAVEKMIEALFHAENIDLVSQSYFI